MLIHYVSTYLMNQSSFHGAAYGPNGAIIHYRPYPESCSVVDSKNLFLLDSGGQYVDGTTDITRTVHFGEPTSRQKDCFTRVLQVSSYFDLFFILLSWADFISISFFNLIINFIIFQWGVLNFAINCDHATGTYSHWSSSIPWAYPWFCAWCTCSHPSLEDWTGLSSR